MTNRAIKIFGIGLVIVGVFSWSYVKIKKSLLIDACLDSGGHWNHETNNCEFDRSSNVPSTFDTTKQIERKKEDLQTETTETPGHGYDELADEDKRLSYEISDYNTDDPGIVNIKRPERTLILNPVIDTTSLFRIWTKYADAPHATFKIDAKEFYVVDYDGDGSMPYILEKDSLTIYYNDFIQRGRIMKVTKDILSIRWNDAKSPTNYIMWKN